MPNSTLIKFLLFFSIGYIAVAPLSDALTYVFRIPGLICITLLSIKNYTKSQPRYPLSLLGISVLCLTNIILLDSGMTFKLFLSIFSVYSLLFLVIVSSNINVDKNLRQSVYKLSVLGAIVLSFHALSPYRHFAGTDQSIYLTFGFSNSNFAGITAFLIYCAVLMTANYNKTRTRYFTIVLAIWLLYLIFLTNCRSAFVAAILVPLAMIFFVRHRLPNILVYFACAIPFLFVPFYLNFAANITENANENIQVMGKGVVSGRENTYREYLGCIEEDYQYVIGTFHSKDYQYTTGIISHAGPFLNAHNGPLAYFVSLGALGTLFVFRILIDKLRRSNSRARSTNAKCAVFVILSVFIESCGEASLFLGGFPGITYIFLFYVMAASDNGKFKQA